MHACVCVCVCVWVCVQDNMSQVKQVGLLAAGCQPWNKDVCAASGDRFAYCATLAIYIYQVCVCVSLCLSVSMCSITNSPPPPNLPVGPQV